ncbi:MAG: hypothetical protein P4M07_14415 [Xanthobacteraceae bacterium]|nr:hypothetical protein [Xanthobacteraceae bacterium]
MSLGIIKATPAIERGFSASLDRDRAGISCWALTAQPGNRQVIAAIDLHPNEPQTVNAAKPRWIEASGAGRISAIRQLTDFGRTNPSDLVDVGTVVRARIQQPS